MAAIIVMTPWRPGDADEEDFSADPALPSETVPPEDGAVWKELQ